MADARAEEFDANERIAGLSMLSIKRAMQWVGIMERRDDVDQVATALGLSVHASLKRSPIDVLGHLSVHEPPPVDTHSATSFTSIFPRVAFE
jgi:hypothetical protein